MEKTDSEKQPPQEQPQTPTQMNQSNNPLYCSYVDGQFTYKDPNSGVHYVWNENEKKWVVKVNQEGEVDSNKVEEEECREGRSDGSTSVGAEVISPGTSQVQFDGENYTYTDQDGTVFLWDSGKGAWFPKLDEEFMVAYQLGYGGTAPVLTTTKPSKPPPKNEKKDPEWFELDDDKNTHVYVSNLPSSISEEEFVEFMGKCGLVMKDPETGKYKVKLYREASGELKGDGTCTYIKVDSVKLALQILDGSYFRDKVVKVERAKFQMKGEFDPGRKPKGKKRKDKVKIQRMQEKLFSWKPEKLRGERGKHERVVVVKRAFLPSEFEADVGLILELKEDFKSEASKFGDCRKVDLFDNNEEGALKIHMSTVEEADAVINCFNGRFFAGRQLEAYTWDGKEKLNVVETLAEREARLERWEKYVEEDEEGGGGKKPKVERDRTPPRDGRDVDSDDDERKFDED